MPALAAKWMKLKFDDVEALCQLDLSLTITNNTSTEDPCKPADPGLGAGNNVYTVDSKDWSVSFNGRQMINELAMAGVTQSTIAKSMLTGTSTAEITIGTDPETTTNYPYPIVVEYSGDILITELTLNWPATGSSTYDATFQGNSDLQYTEAAYTPTP